MFIKVAGHPTIQTPTLDQLAHNGVRHTNTYTECPVCIPARRTLMTGTRPRTYGDRMLKTFEPIPALPTLAQTFEMRAIRRSLKEKLLEKTDAEKDPGAFAQVRGGAVGWIAPRDPAVGSR